MGWRIGMLLDVYRFVRFSAFGATAVLPLLGAASANPRLGGRRAAGLIGVAAAFHLFAYVDNDLCDLAIDRTQPLRAAYPLVRGAIRPRAARAIALAGVPLAFAIDAWLRRGQPEDAPVGRAAADAPAGHPAADAPVGCAAADAPVGRLFLAGAFVAMAAYNRWGKACPLPPLTDALQGAGWAMLLGYGAAATGRPANQLTACLAAYEVLLILMVNGVHGALRDLGNDAARGARTTAIMLGARAGAGGELRLTPALLAYALALQAALLGLPLWAASRNIAGQRAAPGAVAALGVSAIAGLTLALLGAAARGRMPADDVGILHLLLLLSAPVVLVAPGLSPPLLAALLAAHSISPLANGMAYGALGRLLRAER